MRYLQIVCAAVLLPLSAGILSAQGGANYSAFGLGDIQGSVGAVYDGLGGSSVAVPSQHALGGINPATWGLVTTTRLQTGFTFRQIHISSNSTSTSQNNGRLQGLAGVFSVDTALGIGIGFGFKPYSGVNYLLAETATVNFNGSTLTTTSEYEGEGGLTTAYLGGTFEPVDNVIVGISGLYHFGKITSTVTATFDDANYLPSALQINNGMSGGGISIGLLYTGVRNLTLGATVIANSALSVDVDERYASSVSDDTVLTSTFETDMPLTIAVGASYRTGKFLLTSELASSDFSNLSIRRPEFVSFRRANRISVGASRVGDPTASSALDRWAFSVGAGYNQQYYVVNDNGIDEMYASFGVQIPIARRTFLDGAVTGGMRGTTDNDLLRELFARFSVSISIGETWFKPFKRD